MRRINNSGSVSTPSKRSRSRNTRSTKRNKVSRVPRTIVSVGKAAFPAKLYNTLTYADRYTMTLTAGVYNSILFRANGMYDPYHTGTGHQPMYFDQLTAIYDHWRVLRSRITVTITESSAAGESDLCFCLFVDDDTAPSVSTMYTAMERPGSVYKAFNATNVGGVTLRQSWDGYKVFGPSIYSSDALQGTSGADPTEQSLYVIAAEDKNGVINPNYLGITVKIEYDCQWSELASMASS